MAKVSGHAGSAEKSSIHRVKKGVMSHLKTLYSNEITSKLMDQFGYKNVMQVPKLTKIVLNMGLGEAMRLSRNFPKGL
jgi:hypothetical protein